MSNDPQAQKSPQNAQDNARVVLITGASAGIGREMAKLFVARGWHVAATARRADRLTALEQECAGKAGTLLTVEADVVDPAAMQRAVDQIAGRFGRLDVIIANAGIGQRGAIIDSAWDDLNAVLRTNIDGVLHTVRAGVPLMQSGKSSGKWGGQIILISSVLAQAVGPYTAIYSASKMAVNGIARGLREELRADHIRVTNILLGQTHTEFTTVRRGVAGRTASVLPTMRADQVAARIMHIADRADRAPRTLTLRLIDHAINIAGVFFAPIMDRVLARVYRPKSPIPTQKRK